MAGERDGAMDDAGEGPNETAFEVGIDAASLDGYENGHDRADHFALDRATRYPVGNSTAAGAVANFVNTIVGAGIIGLPFALAQSGLWAGIFMMCLAAALSNRATNMLIAAGEKSGRLNYEELMAEVFGDTGIYAFSLFAGVLAFGAMSAYLIIVGDILPEILLASDVTTGVLAERSSVIAIFGLVFILPVSLLKDLSKLSYTSFVSVLADLLLLLIVCFTGASEASENDDVDRSEINTFIRPTIFAGFGAISFAFVCQHSSFLIYRSLAKPGVRRWAWVTRWSLTIALTMGLALALGGFLNFGEETEGNILNNFSVEHKPASVARAFLATTMVFTYPMEMYVARHVLDVSIFQTLLGKGPITSARHYGITVGIWALSMALALATNDLGSILEIFGAFSATVVGYIMPALLHMKANRGELRRAKAAWAQGSTEYLPTFRKRLWSMRNFYVPIFMVVFGFIAMIAGVGTAAWSEYELSQTKA